MNSSVIQQYFDYTFGTLLVSSLQFFLSWYFVWLPILIIPAAWYMWVQYVRQKFLAGIEYVLLEIRVPREVTKGPLAMELILSTLHQPGGESNWYDRYVKGKTRAQFCFELVSLEGVVHFYVRTRKDWRQYVETQFYAQYSGVEVVEVPDYMSTIGFDPKDPNRLGVWGMDYKLAKPAVYPIKTYIDWGLDQVSEKEEFKTDPITTILETLGHLGKGEKMWIQIITRAHKKEAPHGTFTEKPDWTTDAKNEIKKILGDAYATEEEKDGKKKPSFRDLSPGQGDLIKGIERNISKPAFDCVIRSVYVAEKDKFRGSVIPTIVGMFKPFQHVTSNGIVINAKVLMPKFEGYPWEDPGEKEQNKIRKFLIEASKRRAAFYEPYVSSEPFILNTEALASIFHLPGSVAQAPSLEKIMSKRSEPPANLPL